MSDTQRTRRAPSKLGYTSQGSGTPALRDRCTRMGAFGNLGLVLAGGGVRRRPGRVEGAKRCRYGGARRVEVAPGHDLQIGGHRDLVDVVDTGEGPERAGRRFGVEALRIPLLAEFD